MASSSDPNVGLEDVDAKKSLDFAVAANKMCLKALGDPTKAEDHSRILRSLESDERIPFVSKMGTDESGSDLLYNLWKDGKVSFVFCDVASHI